MINCKSGNIYKIEKVVLIPCVYIFYIMISIINHSTKIQIFNMKYDLE